MTLTEYNQQRYGGPPAHTGYGSVSSPTSAEPVRPPACRVPSHLPAGAARRWYWCPASDRASSAVSTPTPRIAVRSTSNRSHRLICSRRCFFAGASSLVFCPHCHQLDQRHTARLHPLQGELMLFPQLPSSADATQIRSFPPDGHTVFASARALRSANRNMTAWKLAAKLTDRLYVASATACSRCFARCYKTTLWTSRNHLKLSPLPETLWCRRQTLWRSSFLLDKRYEVHRRCQNSFFFCPDRVGLEAAVHFNL